MTHGSAPRAPKLGSVTFALYLSGSKGIVVALVGEDLAALPKKARAQVEQNMQPGEPVLFVLIGTGNQAIVALENRLLISKSGMLAGATFGGRCTSFNYADIGGIQVNTVVGCVTVDPEGGTSRVDPLTAGPAAGAPRPPQARRWWSVRCWLRGPA